ncbi:cytochrome P450 [Amylostereum chailletii]|nr:cytochrome P450 [Amylostereum chailletii]
MTFSLSLFVLLLCMFIAWRLFHSSRARGSKRLPPGPAPLPFIGNFFDVPRAGEWETFTEWGRKYGDIVYLSVAGQSAIIVNTAEAANDLMAKRSSMYSERPRLPLIELLGQGTWNLGFMNYGRPWQVRKSMMMTKLAKGSLDRFVDHLRLYSGRLIIDATYGISILSRDHELIRIAEKVMHNVTVALCPIFWFFNPVPLLSLWPKWLGGGRVDTLVKEFQENDRLLRYRPFEMVKAFVEAGSARTSYTSLLLSELDPAPGSEEEVLIRDAAAIAYGAGADTALAVAEIFFLAMLQNPDVQAKAREEIDRVVGGERLPSHEDRKNLPYVNAIMKEVMRWHAATPLGIAHKLNRDDEYNGMHIPAGTLVIANIWGILRDPSVYPEPEKFKPERFLLDGQLYVEGRDPADLLFGFGRRVCPGIHLAQECIFLLIAQVLATFVITTIDGKPAPHVEMTSGGASFPSPYKCNIRLRSDGTRELITMGECS